ncbi:MAG: class I SAM-dependent methyltransferase, partial [Propionibacteriaceae bacterium]|nr:class I SAM-dependent methyltransferase [Propionibacteriaceae bacterium]
MGCGDGRLSTAFYRPSFLVYGLDRDEAKVSQARQYAATTGKSSVISFDTLRSNQLPLIDNTVNLLIAEDAGQLPLTEIMRVLVPNGVAY